MDTEDICIISTPQPRRFHRQNNSVATATSYNQHLQSGKKRRAPCRRFELASKEKDFHTKNYAQLDDDDDGMPAAKRFKHSTTAVLTCSSTTNKQQNTTTSSATFCHRETAPELAGIGIVESTLRQSCRLATLTEKDEMGRNRSRAQTPVNPAKMVHSNFESPQPVSHCKYEKDSRKNDGNYHKVSSATRFVTPPRPGVMTASPIASRLTNICLNNKTPVRESSPLPGSCESDLELEELSEGSASMFHDPYKTPRRTSHKSKQLIINELQYNVTPTRITSKTPDRPIGSSIHHRRSSPPTPNAPLRARRNAQQSLIQALLSDNKRQVEAALMAGEDPNEEVSLPFRIDNERATISSSVRRQNMLPLLAAAKLNTSASVIEKLIVHGAVPNSVNSLGQTALHIICLQKLNAQQASFSERPSETPSSGPSPSSTSSTPIPRSWLKLQEFFETLSPEPAADSSKNLSDQQQFKPRLSNTKADHVDDENLGTPKWSTKLSSVRSDKGTFNDQFNSIKESDLVLNVKMLLKYGTDEARKDVHGRTAADYAKENGFRTLHEILCNHQQSCHNDDSVENHYLLDDQQGQKKNNKNISQPVVIDSHSLDDKKPSCVSPITTVNLSTAPISTKRQTSLLSYFPTASPPRLNINSSRSPHIDDRHCGQSHFRYHHQNVSDVQASFKKDVEPPDRRGEKQQQTPLLLLSSLSTQKKRSYHKGTSEDQLRQSRSNSSNKNRLPVSSTTPSSPLKARQRRQASRGK